MNEIPITGIEELLAKETELTEQKELAEKKELKKETESTQGIAFSF